MSESPIEEKWERDRQEAWNVSCSNSRSVGRSPYSWRRKRKPEAEPSTFSLGTVLAEFRALEPDQQGEFFRRLFADAPDIEMLEQEAEELPECGACGSRRYIPSRRPSEIEGYQLDWRAMPCPECLGARLAELRQARIFADSGITVEYEDAVLHSTEPFPNMTPRQWDDYLMLAAGEPVSAYFWGSLGMGKTWASIALGRSWLDRGRQLLFVTSIELLDRLKATFDREADGPTTEEVMRAAEQAPVLILDDIGREAEDKAGHATAWACERMFTLINFRQIRRLPTLYTSNKSLDELGRHYRDMALVTRLRRQCGANVFHLQGRDLR